MDKNKAVVKARKYLSLVMAFQHVESAFLFGSYASGTATPESDIDIGIFIPSLEEDYFLLLKKLYTLRREVDTLIEPHVYINTIDRSGFQDEVKKGIRLI
jgi:predicted nucleotidyltransferase